MSSYDLPTSLEGCDEMLNDLEPTVWQGLGQPIGAAGGVQLDIPMALDPILLETKAMCYLSGQPWPSEIPDWGTHEDPPPNPSDQTGVTVLTGFGAPETDTQSTGSEGSELFWLTDCFRAKERPESELERLDDSETIAFQVGTYFARSTRSSDPLKAKDKLNTSPEAPSDTSFSPFSSLGLLSDSIGTSSLSQAASTISSSSNDWLEDGSLAEPSPHYFGKPQAWDVLQQPSDCSTSLAELLCGDRPYGGSEPFDTLALTSNIPTTYSEHAMRHYSNFPIVDSSASFQEGCRQPLTMLSTGDALSPSNYSPAGGSGRLRLDGTPSPNIRQVDQNSFRPSIHPSSFTPYVRSAWPFYTPDNGKEVLSPRTDCKSHPNVQPRTRLARRVASPESTQERGSRQHRRRRNILDEPVTVRGSKSSSRSVNPTSATVGNAYRRRSKDAFLVRSKSAGMSYKEIKARGHFTEAESTLRGRFRALTKNRKQRVRKPEWTDRDIELLLAAVEALTEDVSPSRTPNSSRCRARGSSKPPKIPWKQVADCIASRGGSYHFGNATCRKKWDEIQLKEP
ncbi:MAG: hypothetical protein M1836_000378 [Candelina mexicana]|nr:MAG: hypothetical protein M1836_000378 [Candelina mexicana]